VERIEALGLPRVGAPLVQHVDGDLWEMRPSGNKVEGRALYVTVPQRRVVILVAFMKKRQKTPRRMIELAKRRQKEIGA
jgi:phage-related protein